MKLRNKKTGEMAELCSKQQIYEDKAHLFLDTKNGRQYYASLTELNEEWEDYDDTKDHWCIRFCGEAKQIGSYADREEIAECKQIGNYFKTKEEAEQTVEKLKAWKRLKGHGLRVERGQRIFVNADNKLTSQKPLFAVDTYEEVEKDLDLLFGGEE